MKKILGVLLLVPALAFGQGYPSKPVRLIVGFPAGGPADIFGRALAQGMASELGQPVVVENVSGVGGVLGVDRVAKSAPDGYTLVLSSFGPMAIAPFVYPKLGYDPAKDLAPITLAATSWFFMVVNPSLPVKSVKEFIALAKSRPGEINFASGTVGATPYLAGEIFKQMAGINIGGVAYKGTGPAVAAVMGGLALAAGTSVLRQARGELVSGTASPR